MLALCLIFFIKEKVSISHCSNGVLRTKGKKTNFPVVPCGWCYHQPPMMFFPLIAAGEPIHFFLDEKVNKKSPLRLML